jgi:hypothetical protein
MSNIASDFRAMAFLQSPAKGVLAEVTFVLCPVREVVVSWSKQAGQHCPTEGGSLTIEYSFRAGFVQTIFLALR